MDLMETITKHVIEARYNDLSTQTVEMTKKVVMDSIGVTVGGSGTYGIKDLVDLVGGWGGKEESTFLVYGNKVPAHHAALVNSTMARALDFDDVHEAGGGHLGACFVPPSLILAEYVQRPVSGKDLILAIAVGADVSARIRSALTPNPGWGEAIHPFGIVAMGAKFLGFDQDQLINGMGLAYTQASGNWQGGIDGGFIIRLSQGVAAKAGVLSTVLARHGFTGGRNAFEGNYGFYPLYGRNQYNRESITDQLGKRFEIVNTSIKPYPCCKLCHIPIYATLEIIDEHKIDPREIKKITILGNTKTYKITGPSKIHPDNVVDAQFSTPYTVACAAIRKKVFIDDFTEASIKDGDVLELAQKVNVKVDPELDKKWGPGANAPNHVEIETKWGKRYSKFVELIKGHPENPMTWDECIEKFQQCVRFSAKRLQQDKITELARLITKLEEMDDVRGIVKLLVP